MQEPNDQRVLDQTILDIVNLLSTFKSLDFEKENPEAFGGMYQFWCQKVV